MSAMPDQDYEYSVGGAVPLNNPTYVERQADADLYQKLKAGEFCYVLNSRQMGKSSLLIRTRQKLEKEKIACVNIDIAGQIGTAINDLNQWYDTLIEIIADGFKLDFPTWWYDYNSITIQRKLSIFTERILLKKIKEKIVIFVDEIDSTINLNFPVDDFFKFIRYCYNQRASNSEYNRLTFALFGVPTPSDLIQDKKRTPFNIGSAIQLDGFRQEEAQPLVEGLKGKVADPQIVLEHVLQWTGGQPFLTQKLCSIISTSDSSLFTDNEEDWVEQFVRLQIIDNWESQDNPEHLKTIRNRILRDEQRAGHLLNIYRQILQDGAVIGNDSQEQIELRLSGLVVKEGIGIRVYNRIYENIFDWHWVNETLKNVRPYAKAMKAWLNSGDEVWLLYGEALQKELEWAKGSRNLGVEDFDFFNACRELDKQIKEIRTGILSNKRYDPFWLLVNYRQILKREVVATDNNLEQLELENLGLIVNQEKNLRVARQIYEKVFHIEWVEDKLADLRPYGLNIVAWLDSNCQEKSTLLQGIELEDILEWLQDKELRPEENNFLISSQVYSLRLGDETVWSKKEKQVIQILNKFIAEVLRLKKARRPQFVIQQVLFWTRANFSLTQKLCQLILEPESFIGAGEEAKQVENLVRSRIIGNGEQ